MQYKLIKYLPFMNNLGGLIFWYIILISISRVGLQPN